MTTVASLNGGCVVGNACCAYDAYWYLSGGEGVKQHRTSNGSATTSASTPCARNILTAEHNPEASLDHSLVYSVLLLSHRCAWVAACIGTPTCLARFVLKLVAHLDREPLYIARGLSCCFRGWLSKENLPELADDVFCAEYWNEHAHREREREGGEGSIGCVSVATP